MLGTQCRCILSVMNLFIMCILCHDTSETIKDRLIYTAFEAALARRVQSNIRSLSNAATSQCSKALSAKPGWVASCAHSAISSACMGFYKNTDPSNISAVEHPQYALNSQDMHTEILKVSASSAANSETGTQWFMGSSNSSRRLMLMLGFLLLGLRRCLCIRRCNLIRLLPLHGKLLLCVCRYRRTC